MELKNTNNDIMENPKNGDNSLKDSEPLKNLAAVLVQLKEASGQACACAKICTYALFDLHVCFQISCVLILPQPLITLYV